MHVCVMAIVCHCASRRTTSTVGPLTVPWQRFEQIGPLSVQKRGKCPLGGIAQYYSTVDRGVANCGVAIGRDRRTKWIETATAAVKRLLPEQEDSKVAAHLLVDRDASSNASKY